MFYGRGYRTKSGKYCTIMGGPNKSKKCIRLGFFSSPRKIFRKEPLGIDWKYDNAKLLNQNRFVLEQLDNENMTCSWGFGYKQEIVDCLLDPKQLPHQSCDSEDKDYFTF